MSDEHTEQTNVSSLREDDEEEYQDDDELPARQHPLPWVLFGVAAVLLALVGGLLAKRLNAETRRANEEIEKSVGLKAQLEAVNKQHADVDQRIADAEAKAKAAEDASIDAATKLKKVEAERDKLQKDLEAMAKKVEAGGAAAAKEPPAKKGKAGKKGKKKKKR